MILVRLLDGVFALAGMGLNAVARLIARVAGPPRSAPSLEAADPVSLATPEFEEDDSVFVSRIRKRIRRRRPKPSN